MGTFLRELRVEGVTDRLAIVAHSNGGLAARSFLTNPPDPTISPGPEAVAQLVTYGTPHRGADIEIWSNIIDLIGAQGACSPLIRSIATVLGYDDCQKFIEDLTALPSAEGARDAGFECNDEKEIILSPFLDRLEQKKLPENVKYSSIISHDTANLGLYPSLFPLGNRGFTDDCHSKRWDGLVPTSSADLGLSDSISKPLTKIENGQFHAGQGNDFSSILTALYRLSLAVEALSPVSVVVTAPDDRKISSEIVEIPGASYNEFEDADDHTKTVVLIPLTIEGSYRINVIPKTDASPTDTYTLKVTQNGTSVILVEDQSLPIRLSPTPTICSVHPFS